MKRRDFIKYTGASASFAPVLLNSIPVQAFADPFLMSTMDCTTLQERVLVIVQLFGGNDGLNTLVPIDQYSTYAQLRPTIKIPESGSGAYLNLDSTLPVADQVGLNPNMPEFQAMYDNGLMSVVQGVGYDNHNRSHFKSTDLIMTGGDGQFQNFSFDTGWMGRYLDHTFPGLAGYSSPVMPDPLGIQLGNTESSLGFHIKGEFGTSINLSGQDLAGYYTLISAIGGAPISNLPISEYGEELSYAMAVEASASSYSSRISSVFNQGSNALSYPSYNLANQLKTVARLLSGGCKTKIFLVYRTGFDTHGNQLNRHTNLLQELSQSMKAFQDDLTALGLNQRVTTVTMSEFGRKAFENGNGGTDHGTLNSMFVFGSALKGGVYGTNLDLSVLDDGAPLNLQHDYRQVLATLLQDWLGADTDALTAAKFEAFETQKLDLIQDSQVADENFVCPSSGQHIGEVGNLTGILQPDSNTWHSQLLTHSYSNPVVVMGPANNAGGQALTIRVRNVTSNSFEWQVDEWDYLDGYHIAIDISYVVVEAGSYELESGKMLVAGIEPAVTDVFTDVLFPETFTNPPAVFAQITSVNETSAVVCRMKDIDTGKVTIKVQEEEANDGTHAGEMVSWIAIEPGSFDSDTMNGEAGTTGTLVGITDHTISYSRPYSNNPVLLANIQTYAGNNPVNVRYKNLTSTETMVYLQEEQSQDTELGHVSENVSYAVFDQAGTLWGIPVSGTQARKGGEELLGEQLPAFRINCYPNPFISKFLIEPLNATADKLIVDITDIRGKQVFRQAGFPSDQLITIAGNQFLSGTYLVRVIAGDQVSTFRMLKS